MNRRELLAKITATAAAAGVPGAEAKAIEPEPRPLFFVLRMPADAWISCRALRNMRKSLDDFLKERGLPPCIVLMDGLDIAAVTDPRES
jgi:hypothetical protein